MLTSFINSKTLHIIECIKLVDIKEIVDILLKVVTGVGIFRGMYYLKSFKEKTNSATFTFWSQLRLRIFEILRWLSDDYGLVDNFYGKNTRCSWDNILPPDEERIAEFKCKVEETMKFLKITPDQMPAYIGWTKDYNILMEFLNDVMQYDICDKDNHYKFKEIRTIPQREEYCQKICQAILNLCNGIDSKQKEIEMKIL